MGGRGGRKREDRKSEDRKSGGWETKIIKKTGEKSAGLVVSGECVE